MHFATAFRTAALVLAGSAVSSVALAADGFKVRYPLSGSLGGEIVAPLNNPGWYGSLVLTQVAIDKVTGDDGEQLKVTRSGTTPPATIAGQPRTASFSGSATLDVEQDQTIGNMLIGYLFAPTYYGGRVSLAVNLPYTFSQKTRAKATGATPTLTALSPALTSPPLPAGAPAAAQANAQAQFNTFYQNGLAGSSVDQEIDGFGDMEITGAWIHSTDKLRIVAGLTLALPTGKYDADGASNIGFGKFYTLRPGVGLAYKLNDTVTLGARGSLGFNSRNTENDIRSGNFGAVDLAVAFRTPIGVVGPHLLHVQQFQDDSGGDLGANRFRATGAGFFFTTLVKPLDAGLNLAFMKVIDSRNALSGTIVQVRLSKAF